MPPAAERGEQPDLDPLLMATATNLARVLVAVDISKEEDQENLRQARKQIESLTRASTRGPGAEQWNVANRIFAMALGTVAAGAEAQIPSTVDAPSKKARQRKRSSQ